MKICLENLYVDNRVNKNLYVDDRVNKLTLSMLRQSVHERQLFKI